jgi:flagellar FliJ protein
VRRFQFRLERFLELRRWKERQWEIALAKIQGVCLSLERRIAEIAAEIGASRLVGYTVGARIDVEAMARRELYVLRLARERERTRETLQEKRKELAKVLASYLEASKDRKVLDKLKERRAEEYYDRQLDEEFKNTDDMNTAAAVNARRSESAEYRGSESAEYRDAQHAEAAAEAR